MHCRLYRIVRKLAVIVARFGLVLPIFFAVSAFVRCHVVFVQGRIGPLACIPEYCSRMMQIGEFSPRDLFLFVVEKNENSRLVSILWRRWPVLVADRFSEFASEVFAGLEKNNGAPFALAPLNRPFALAKGEVRFTQAEETEGRELLEKMGIGPSQWFVCFHSRDPLYLRTRHPSRDWSYHDYRDTDIKLAYAAMQHVVDQGGIAVRVGSHPGTALLEGPGIIDYAASHRSEFGDLYILAKCRFMVGCSSGLTGVATMFDVPVAMNNLIPYSPGPHGPEDIFTPKLIWSQDRDRLLTFDECMELGLFDPIPNGTVQSFYDANRLSPVENSADEILDLCLDMLDKLDGRSVDHELAELQERFNVRYYAKYEDLAFRARIGPRFIAKYRHLIG